jgi:hypothetical protein
LHELFAVKDFIDPHAWDIPEVRWSDFLKDGAGQFPPDVRKVIGYLP